MVNCESKERVQIVPADEGGACAGSGTPTDFSVQFNAVYRAIRDIKPVDYGVSCMVETDSMLEPELIAITKSLCGANYGAIKNYLEPRKEVESVYSITRPAFKNSPNGVSAGFSVFRYILKRLGKIGYVKEYREKKARDDSPAITAVEWKFTQAGKTFICNNQWYERFVADLMKAVLDSAAPAAYELVSGAEVRLHNNTLAEFDVMAAVGGKVLAIEVKTSAYTKAAETSRDFERCAERLDMFGIDSANACLVCLDKTDDELEKLRAVANGRFAVHDNRTFSGWFAETIKNAELV